MELVTELPPSVFNLRNQIVLNYLGKHKRQETQRVLYEHQVDAVLRVREYFDPVLTPSGSNIALVVLPTGCGKTGVAVLASYALNASRVLVITPSIAISKQVDKAYDNFLVERGCIAADQNMYFMPSKATISKSTEIPGALACNLMITNAHKISGRSRVQIQHIDANNYDLVIVDEAHHYPAPTWRLLVDHFSNSKRLFLTATPLHNGIPILDEGQTCFTLRHQDAVDRGIIRAIDFDEVTGGDDVDYIYMLIAGRMEHWLNIHDRQDSDVKHQGMVLTQTIDDLNSATAFCDVYNSNFGGAKCAVYVSNTHRNVLDDFKRQEIRTLVVIGKLLEGFDHKPVSVLGIVRNVAPSSRVLFAQFVGRALRKCHDEDPVTAQLVTHTRFEQRANFTRFESLAEEDPPEEED